MNELTEETRKRAEHSIVLPTDINKPRIVEKMPPPLICAMNIINSIYSCVFYYFVIVDSLYFNIIFFCLVLVINYKLYQDKCLKFEAKWSNNK